CQALAPFGIVRALGLTNGNTDEYVPTAQAAALAQLHQTRFCSSFADDLAALDASYAQVRAARHPLGNLPLVVLTHGKQILPAAQVEQQGTGLKNDLAGLPSNSRHTVAANSGHHIHLEQPDLVVQAIKDVLAGHAQPTP